MSAGDWIKMRSNIHEDPRVFQISHALGLHRFQVVGMLHRVWSWADSQSLDGNGLSVTETYLDTLVECNGFCVSLRKVGWLAGEEMALSFPRFHEHNGETAKARALTQQRVRRHRNAYVTPAPLPEKRREEKNGMVGSEGHAGPLAAEVGKALLGMGVGRSDGRLLPTEVQARHLLHTKHPTMPVEVEDAAIRGWFALMRKNKGRDQEGHLIENPTSHLEQYAMGTWRKMRQ